MSLTFLLSLFSSALQDTFPGRNLLNTDPRENVVIANKIVLCSFSRQARLEREAAERAAAASASSPRRRKKGPNQNKKNKRFKEIFWIYWNLYRFNPFYLWLSSDILLISCIFLLLYINETDKNKTFFSFVSKDLFQSVDSSVRFISSTLPDTNNSYGAFSQELITALNFGSLFLPVRPKCDKKNKAGSQISRFAARKRGCS